MKLTSEQKSKLKEHVATLEGLKDKLFNQWNVVEEAVGDLNIIVGDAQDAMGELEQFMNETRDALQEAFDSKSETWQESEKGSELSEQIEAWDPNSIEMGVDDVDLKDVAPMPSDAIEELLEKLKALQEEA